MKKIKIVLVLLISISAALTVAGFSDIPVLQSEKLKTMQQSLPANMELQTANEIRRFEHDDDKSLGKPRYAEIMISYLAKESHTPTDVHNEITNKLIQNGWKREIQKSPANNGSKFASFAKVHGDYNLETTVYIQTAQTAIKNQITVLIESIPMHSEYKNYE